MGESKEAAGEFATVAKVGDVAPGSCIGIEYRGALIALCNLDGELHAVEDVCTHAGAKISEGRLDGNCLICPWHDASFDVTSGEPAGGPAFSPVPKFEVRVVGSEIQVRIPPE